MSSPPVILIGGQSRSAAAIRAHFPSANVFTVGRGEGGADATTPDYAQVPVGVPFADATVVNCVGTDRGDAAVLDHANRAVPLAWARAARDGGARQFIQLSSFSVYSPTDVVRRVSLARPASDYGRSKLAAETGLASLAGAGLAIAVLRVPILVASARHDESDKLEMLVRMIRALGTVPAPAQSIRRAMLTYDGLGAAVSMLAARRADGLFAAADPEPFSYELVAECASAAGIPIRRAPVPRIAIHLLRMARPSLAHRLFESMDLAPEHNLLVQGGYGGTLRQAITLQFLR